MIHDRKNGWAGFDTMKIGKFEIWNDDPAAVDRRMARQARRAESAVPGVRRPNLAAPMAALRRWS